MRKPKVGKEEGGGGGGGWGGDCLRAHAERLSAFEGKGYVPDPAIETAEQLSSMVADLELASLLTLILTWARIQPVSPSSAAPTRAPLV